MSDSASFNPFATAQTQFDRIADLIGLDEGIRGLLRVPMREFHFSVPVRMDDGQVRVFPGFRVQHNDARGPGKGGVRFHPLETVDTIRALAMWMTWKTAIVDLPLGGSMGGVVCDPHVLSTREQERISRGWVRQVARNLGPILDVPEPDMMTGPQHMTWMMDEYDAICGGRTPGAITGKPTNAGGSLGRTESAGYGLVYTLREALKELEISPSDTTASVQGFGKVAQHAIELYEQIGGTVTCVSSWDQASNEALAFTRNGGIDLQEVRRISDRFGGIDRTKAEGLGYTVLPGSAWLEQEVDILLPAAIENQITLPDVERVPASVRVVAEGANGPTSPDAEKMLCDRGVHLIPDLLANAGGVICSYFEQVQSNMNYFWTMGEVLSKLDLKLTAAYIEASDLARAQNLSLRDAALVIAVDRVATVCRERGWV